MPPVPFLGLFWLEGFDFLETHSAPVARWTRRGVLVLLLILGARNLVPYSRETREDPAWWGRYFTDLQ